VKLKLDENLGRRGRDILSAAGHEVCTVVEQSLTGFEDRALIERCREEGRCLVTLDLDFANPLAFLPSRYAGIAVLRLPAHPSNADILALVQTLARALEHGRIDGKLWIVEAGRIRIYQEKPSD
jgi:predicted nuclease of predicted toxin-antitoxin system